MANKSTQEPSSSNLKFTARGGTTDQGKDFEELMIISKCLELTLDSNVAEFTISADNVKFGDFDDLVVESKSIKGEYRKAAYQLKHVEAEDKPLTPKILGGTGDKFSILKYYRSSSQVQGDFSLILYTNKKFEMKEEKLTMECGLKSANILVDISKAKRENEYGFTLNNAENVLEGDIEKYQKFLNRFYLRSNQENTKLLERRIRNVFLKIGGTEDTFLRFRDFIKRWKKVKKYKLDKRLVAIKIVESLLTSYIKTISDELYYTKFGNLLRKAILSFNFTTFEETNEVIHKIWSNNTMSDDEINKCSLKHFLLTERLDQIKDKKLKANKYSLISWHLGQCPLIVEVTKDSKAATIQAVELLKKNQIGDRKLLLLGQKEELQISSCFRNLHCIRNDNEELYREILETFSCPLQGRLYKLRDIVVSEDFEKIVNTDCLVKINDPEFNIGERQEELPEFYVPRALPRLIVDSKFLEEEKSDDLILINCNGKEEAVKQHVKGVTIVDLKELLGDNDDGGLIRKTLTETFNSISKKIICLHPTEYSYEEYSKIVNKFPNKNCHHFGCCGENVDFEWINTRGNVKVLQPYKTAKEVFEKEDEFLQTNRRNLKVVCADPGMGKTTLLKYFCTSGIKSSWLLHITARQHASRITENMDVQNFVFSLTSDRLERKFVKTFYGRKAIIFLWDGLDEVLDSEERHRIYGFIMNIQQLGFVQFITARCNLQEEIEDRLDTLATNIKELTKFEQNTFLRHRLSKKYNDEQLSDIIVKIMANVEYLEAQKILEVPLQLYLLTELFLQASDIDDILKKPLTATTLFEYFVNNKFKTHFQRFENKDTYSQKIVKDAVINKYQLLGIKICLKSIAELNFLEQRELDDLSAVEKVEDRYGLVKKSGEMSLFIHQSYAEYFAALFLSRNYKKITNFRKVYFDNRCRNLRFMLDLILAKDCPAHTAVLYRNLRTLEDHKEEIFEEDAAGRNALHIALSWGGEHLELPDISSSAMIKIEDYLNKFKTVGRIFKYMLEDELGLSHVFDKMFDMDYMAYSTESLLELAVVSNDITVVQYIYQDSKSMKRKKDDSRPLLYAAFIGSFEICKFLINNGLNVNCFSKDNFTPLIMAARQGSLDVAKILIDNKAEINTADSAGQTPLFWAVWINQYSVVQLLIENNADANLASNNGLTPLMAAALFGYLDIAKILIDNKAEINTADSNGQTPLFWAAWKHQYSVVQLLIENNADVNLASNNGETPLIVAADFGYLDIAKILIDNKAEINTADSNGQTPLFWAAWKHQYSVVQLLIENNADVNFVSNDGLTPLIMAAQSGYLDIAKILIDNKAEINTADSNGQTHLFWAACRNQYSVVQLLIENNADVNLASNNGSTPLIMAAEFGYLDIAKILIDNKAEINTADSNGHTSLFWAACRNQYTVVQLLIQNNADVNLASNNGFTPLIEAARYGHLDIAKILIDNKAEINTADSDGQTPLFWAAWKNQYSVVQLLIENNADVNLASNNGFTPLIEAARYGHLDIAKALINNNANINHPSPFGTTPLMTATKKGYVEIVNYLLEKKAYINCKDSDGNTALHFSAQNNNLDCIKSLIQNGADPGAKNRSDKAPVELPDLSQEVLDYFRSINVQRPKKRFLQSLISFFKCRSNQ